MVLWRRICSLASLAFVALSPAWGCGPFLYDNAAFDRFSLLDPGILNNPEWNTFLAFASPALGQPSLQNGDAAIQQVIHADRLDGLTSQGVSNLLYDYGSGEDPVSVAANEAWWTDYFRTARHRGVTAAELHRVLYGADRPHWLAPEDQRYLSLLDAEADSPRGLSLALTEARNPRNPVGLRHRFAFWAVRALALRHDPEAIRVFQEFSPGPAPDLPLARAQGWAASVVADHDPEAALALWSDLLVRWPSLRVQTFSSLATLDPAVWTGTHDPGSLVARFFLDGRDFSGQTLRRIAEAEKEHGDRHWAETVFYAMAEQVERESGVFALFGLVDPTEVPPAGLFTGLLDEAQALVDAGTVVPTRTWWLVASYLSLFDGNPSRSAAFLDKARALAALNVDQERQTDLLAALVRMNAEKDRDWSPELQTQVVAALQWGRSLDAPGHNRGLFHSVAVLAAQKALARGHTTQAVLAFGLVQGGAWGNPYSVSADDRFWSLGWAPNDPVALLMDALMTDDDLVLWKELLRDRDLSPLNRYLTARSFLTERDLTWWQAHRALRRGQGEAALALLRTLGPAEATASGTRIFPERTFHYSLDLDPLHPESGRGMRPVSPLALASLMVRIENEAQTKPSSATLLAKGEFWFSLQLSGLPLLFGQPPPLIAFTNGNFEYYGYDGRDKDRSTAVVGHFPLGRPSQTDAWSARLEEFYRTEFSTLGRARRAFAAVVARHEDPDAEFRALLFLQALDGDRFAALADPRYDGVALARTFRTSCETFRSRSL